MGILSETTHAYEPLTEHTLTLRPGATSPTATIAEMAWLTGHWKGEAFGGVAEEIWTSPSSGAMLGIYRLVKDGKAVFYEMLTLVEEDGSLVLRLKHFNPDLTGWEEKDKTVDFPFVGKLGGTLHFDGLAFRPEGRDVVAIFLAMRQKDGKVLEGAFLHTRVLE